MEKWKLGFGRGRGSTGAPQSDNDGDAHEVSVADITARMAQTRIDDDKVGSVSDQGVVQPGSSTASAIRRYIPRGATRGARPMVYLPTRKSLEKEEEEVKDDGVKTDNPKDGEVKDDKVKDDKEKKVHVVPSIPFQATVNFFRICSLPLYKMHQYDVLFDIPKLTKQSRKRLVKLNLENSKCIGAYNGSVLWRPVKFKASNPDQTEDEQNEFSVSVSGVQVRYVYKAEIPVGSSTFLELYGTLFRKWLYDLGFMELGKNIYVDMSPAAIISGFKLEVLTGYKVKVCQCEEELFALNVDITPKFVNQTNLLSYMKECGYRRELADELRGHIVITMYNGRNYRLAGIDFDSNPMTRFKMEEDTETTYFEYYLTNYQTKIKDLKQPLLTVKLVWNSPSGERREEEIRLVPELCQLVGLTDRMAKNLELKKRLKKYRLPTAEERTNKIRGLIDKFQMDEKISREMLKWGVSVENTLMTIPAKTFKKEALSFGNPSVPVTVEDNGTFKWAGKRMAEPVPITNWTIVYPRSVRSGVKHLLDLINKLSVPLGIKVEKPAEIEIPDMEPESYRRATFNLYCQTGQPETTARLLFFVLPSVDNIEQYKFVKGTFSGTVGIITQCFRVETLASPNLTSIVTRLLVQMNVKMKGEPYKINYPKSLNDMLCIAFDDEKQQDGESAIRNGAMVAGLFSNPNIHCSATARFDAREISLAVLKAFKEILTQYKVAASRIDKPALPTSILFFRAGICEGDFHKVYTEEAKTIHDDLANLASSEGLPVPKLSYVVVTRINSVRFFRGDEGIIKNPVGGSVIDCTITHPQTQEFYMTSATTQQGTPSPPRYFVLLNNTGLHLDQIEKLTFKQCHGYFNYPGVISVPALLQSARKLLNLMSVLGDKEVNHSLKDRPHYL